MNESPRARKPSCKYEVGSGCGDCWRHRLSCECLELYAILILNRSRRSPLSKTRDYLLSPANWPERLPTLLQTGGQNVSFAKAILDVQPTLADGGTSEYPVQVS